MSGAALALLVVALVAPPATAPECRRSTLDPAPQWLSGGAWSADGARLVLADLGGGRLLSFEESGGKGRVISYPGSGDLEFTRPLDLAAAGDGYLMPDGQSHFLWLDAELKPLRSLRFAPGQEVPGPVSPVRLFGFPRFVLDGPALLALTYVQEGTAFRRAVHRVQLEPLRLLEDFGDVSPTGEVSPFFWMADSALASVGGQAYRLSFDGTAGIERLSAPRHRLAAFPPGFASLPALPPWSPETTVTSYQIVATSRIARGLYGRGDRLYVLTHQPESGGHRWELTEIDPRKDVLGRTLRLPTLSPELTLVPGPKSWVLIERGAVTGVQQQQTRSMVWIPTAWIEDAEPSPLTSGAKPVECR